MVEPTGYTALDLIGFTDKGPYDPTANYVRNDLVHVGNSTWRCKIDDTTGITPTEGANWTIFIESATSLAGMSDVNLNTPKAGDGLVHDGNDWTNIPIMTKELEIKTGAHNLLRFPTLSELKALNTTGTWSNNVYTFGNATFTVNESEETVTVNCDGTGSAGLYFSLFNRLSKRYYLLNGTYKVNGLDNGEDSASYFALEVSATTKNSTSQAWYVRGINTDGASFTYDDTQIDGLGVTISIMGNHIANNVVVKPMIRYAIDKTTDHAPYAKTNRQLTEEVDKLYGLTNNKISYIRGYYAYGGTISNILTLIQNFLTEISITNDIGVIDVVIAGNTPWSVRGYCFSTKDFAVLTAMRYDGSCKLFYRMSSTDTIKDFTTT